MFINNLNTLHTVPMDLNISILTKYDISNYMEKYPMKITLKLVEFLYEKRKYVIIQFFKLLTKSDIIDN